jgi:inner membrane protein
MMNEIWMWGILGLVLLGIEMATGTFYILWFGIAGLLLSVLVWMFPNMSPAVQVFAFAALSLGSLFLYKKYYKGSEKDDLKVGQSRGDEIGKQGTIIQAVSATQNGKIRFAQGVMGSKEWTVISDEEIAVGEAAKVVAVEGNALRVITA